MTQDSPEEQGFRGAGWGGAGQADCSLVGGPAWTAPRGLQGALRVSEVRPPDVHVGTYPVGGDVFLQGQHGVHAPPQVLVGLHLLLPDLLPSPGEAQAWAAGPAVTGLGGALGASHIHQGGN